MNNNRVVLARVYEDDKLIGIFPRTFGAGGELELESILGLTDDQGIISAEVRKTRLNNPTDKNAKVVPVRSNVPDVFIRMQKGDFAEEVIQAGQDLLESGAIRAAEKIYNPKTGEALWHPQMYAFDAIHALFKRPNKVIRDSAGAVIGFDKVPLLTANWSDADFERRGIRFIPGYFARAGAYIGSGTTLMPGSIVNVGAYIAGEDTMIDGGARVASAVQIGKRVKFGAGSGAEGVLSPKGALPTIIEDDVTIGAMCEVAGIIGAGAMIGSGTVMSKQKRIYDTVAMEFVRPIAVPVGDKMFTLPYIAPGRLAVNGAYKRRDIWVDCTVLLDKKASDTEIAQLAKDADLYIQQPDKR